MPLQKNKVAPIAAEDDIRRYRFDSELGGRPLILPPEDSKILTPVKKKTVLPPIEENKTKTSAERSEAASEPLTEVTCDKTAVGSNIRVGRRFLRNINSWMSSSGNRSQLDMETEGDGMLLAYIHELSSSTAEDIDFDIMDQLLESGADINATSTLKGQCVMHYVATSWNETVAEFLHGKGADIHLKDRDGRTPLHLAASTDHSEMIVWLITHGAELEVRTNVELQTPLHHAARKDSINAIMVLIERGGDYEARDYKGRTPLHLAAELDRTVAAEYLISLPNPAEVRVQDNTGSHVIASLIRTMPEVASLALDQLHKVVPSKRKQYFLLNHLEPDPWNENAAGVKTPFQIAVEEKRHKILSHPVMKTLLAEKWNLMRWYFYIHLSLYFIFLLSWSVVIAFPSVQEKHVYIFPRDTWRIVVELFKPHQEFFYVFHNEECNMRSSIHFIALATYIYLIGDDITEAVLSRIRHVCYLKLRKKMLQDDIDHIYSDLVEEKLFLENELVQLNKTTSTYFNDLWNVLDLTMYSLIFVLIILHIADIIYHSNNLALWVSRVSCFVLIVIWARLFNFARGFQSLGPLVAIISHLIGDILQYFILYAIIFIPYVICFWVLFGGEQTAGFAASEREDLTRFYRVAIMMFRMSLIDEYLYSTLRSVDEAMTAILVITYLLFLAVVGLNLFIALLSDTFQRVYDNAHGIALLQQAKLILSYEEKSCPCMKQYYLTYFHTKCNPRVKYYDDDDDINQTQAVRVEKITHQIYTIVSELQSNQHDHFQKRIHELSEVSDVLTNYISQQDSKIIHITQQLEEIKNILAEVNVLNSFSKPSSTTLQPSFPSAIEDQPQQSSTSATHHYKVIQQDNKSSQSHPSYMKPTRVHVFSRKEKVQPTTQTYSTTTTTQLNKYPSISNPTMSSSSLNTHSLSSLSHHTIDEEGKFKQIPQFHSQFSAPVGSTHHLYGSQAKVRGGSGICQGHRRIRSIRVQDIEDENWGKKLQPIKNS